MRDSRPMIGFMQFTESALISRKRLELQFKGIEIVAVESSQQDIANLIVTGSNFQLFDCAPDGEIVNHNLALLHGTQSDAAKLAKLQIIQMLNSQPDTSSNYGQY